MVKARKYVVKKHFQGMPKRDDFEIVTYDLPPLKEGEILVKAEYISVDPYLRAYNIQNPVPYDQFGFQVAVIQESKSSKFPVGAKVVSHKGWCDYTILDTKVDSKDPRQRVCLLPDLEGLPASLGVGAVGMPGVTAYLSTIQICNPKAGETVAVSGAAGAVGTLVGQIAKARGARVIGFAGSDDKVKWLENELGFDRAYNYKTVDIRKALQEGAPNGIDCYYDNVGGEISSKIMYHMNTQGRVAVIGAISAYNENPTQWPKALILQPAIVGKELKVIGFSIWNWGDLWEESLAQLIKLIKSGQVKAKEHETQGFDKLFDALVGMMNGENFGKAVVKV